MSVATHRGRSFWKVFHLLVDANWLHFPFWRGCICHSFLWNMRKKLSRTCEPELSHSASSPKAPSVSSDCQYCTVESVRTKEQVFISPEGKNPWGVGKIDGRNNVWLAFNCICKQERPKRIRRPIRSDQNTDSTAYKEMLDQANYSLPSTRLKSSYKFRCSLLFTSKGRWTTRTRKEQTRARRFGLSNNLTMGSPMALLTTGETNITWPWFAESAKGARIRPGVWLRLTSKRGGWGSRWLRLKKALFGRLRFSMKVLILFAKSPLFGPTYALFILQPASQFVR